MAHPTSPQRLEEEFLLTWRRLLGRLSCGNLGDEVGTRAV